jgi:hypothetical protein
VPQLEVGQLAGLAVGDEGGDPVPVDVGDPQLRAGVGTFLAHDQPHPGRPARQVEQAGQLGDPGAGADLAVGVVGGRPRLGRDLGQLLLDRRGVAGQGEADRVESRRRVSQASSSWVPPAPSTRTRMFLPRRRRPGNWRVRRG